MSLSLPLPDAEVSLDAHWLPPEAASTLFGLMLVALPWEVHPIKMFGREHAAPRLSCWIGDPGTTYRYSGRIPAVARQGSGIAADYKLVLDMRRFESDYAGQAVPAATIEVNAKLLHAQDQQVVMSRTFLQTQLASSAPVPAVVDAFESALTNISRDISGWVLTEGNRHERSAHQ